MVARILLLIHKAVLLHDLLLDLAVVNYLGLGQLGQQLHDQRLLLHRSSAGLWIRIRIHYADPDPEGEN